MLEKSAQKLANHLLGYNERQHHVEAVGQNVVWERPYATAPRPVGGYGDAVDQTAQDYSR